MNRIDRLFGILTLLQSKKYVPAEKIAERFKMSVRTVYRDVKALGESGIPVSFEPSKGYFIVQGYFLPPVSFTSDEANALMFMETMAHSFGDRSIHTHYSNALSKVKSVLRSSQKEKVEILSGNIKMQIPASMKYDFEYLTILQESISSKLIIDIEYKNQNEQVSRRQVEPIGLIFYALHWHLIAWCHLRNEYRDFKVSRIVNLKNTWLAFKKFDHMELNNYLKLLPVDY